MNGTSHRTMSPAPTGPTPAPRASPVARRLRLGDDVSAFCDSIGITRRIVAHLPRPFLPPSAASKLLALLVALVALATANAATLQGSVGGGYQYTTTTTTTTQEAFATSVSTASASWGSWTSRTNYDNTFKTHVDTVAAANGPTWQAFKTLYGDDADFIGKYVDDAAVSPDFKT